MYSNTVGFLGMMTVGYKERAILTEAAAEKIGRGRKKGKKKRERRKGESIYVSFFVPSSAKRGDNMNVQGR